MTVSGTQVNFRYSGLLFLCLFLLHFPLSLSSFLFTSALLPIGMSVQNEEVAAVSVLKLYKYSRVFEPESTLKMKVVDAFAECGYIR